MQTNSSVVSEVKPKAEGTLPPGLVLTLNLSLRATNVLSRLNLHSYSDLFSLSETFLRRRPNCGRKTVTEIMNALEALRKKRLAAQTPNDGKSAIHDLGLSPASDNVIRNFAIQSVSDLAVIPDEDLLRTKLDPAGLTEFRAKFCELLATNGAAALEDSNPIEYLRLSVRASKAIQTLKIMTVGDLAKFPSHQFPKLRNFGSRSFHEIQLKLLNYFIHKGTLDGQDRYGHARIPHEPRAFVEKLLTELPQDLRDIVTRRFGLWHRAPETLEDIGDSRGCTRERIRQLESKALASLRWPGNLKMVRRFLERLYERHFRPVLLKGCGMATEDEVRTVFLSLFSSPQEAVPIERLISKTFLNGKSVYEECCLKTHDGLFAADEEARQEYLSAVKAVEAYLARTQKPTTLSNLIAVARKPKGSSSPRIAKEALVRFIRIAPRIRTDDSGLFGLARWRYMRPKTLRDMIVRSLIDIGKPAHFTQIAMRVNERFCADAPINARNIHARLAYDQETFVWQSTGVYGLSAWGLKKAPYVKERLTQILKSARQPMSLDQIVPKVLETCHCNDHTPSAILEANPALFIKLDKGVYGLREWAS